MEIIRGSSIMAIMISKVAFVFQNSSIEILEAHQHVSIMSTNKIRNSFLSIRKVIKKVNKVLTLIRKISLQI
jgi:hypothetical protein